MEKTQLWVPLGEEALELIYYPNLNAPLVLFCHGFPGDYKHYDLAERLNQAGLAVAVLKYRGVDASSGFFNFRNAIDDVRTVVPYVSKLIGSSDGIGLFGYSAGAYYGLNVAIETPTIKSVCALSPIVDLPRTARLKFENIYDLMLEAPKKIRVLGVHDLVASFAEVWRDYNVLERVQRLQGTPLLIIEGDDNNYGDPAQARMLYEAANEPKEFRGLVGAGHFFANPEHREQIGAITCDFFRRTLLEQDRRSA